jgi:hypothetical protein
MPPDYCQFFIPIIGLSLNVIVQVLTCRYIPATIFGLLKSVFLGFLFGFICVVLLEFKFVKFSACGNIFLPLFITGLLTYSSLGYCYFHFINLGETARRIRILRELYDSPGGLTMEELLKRYNAGDIFAVRIERLIANHQLIYKGGRYYIGSRVMLLISKIVVAFKQLLLSKTSEFDINL